MLPTNNWLHGNPRMKNTENDVRHFIDFVKFSAQISEKQHLMGRIFYNYTEFITRWITWLNLQLFFARNNGQRILVGVFVLCFCLAVSSVLALIGVLKVLYKSGNMIIKIFFHFDFSILTRIECLLWAYDVEKPARGIFREAGSNSRSKCISQKKDLSPSPCWYGFRGIGICWMKLLMNWDLEQPCILTTR